MKVLGISPNLQTSQKNISHKGNLSLNVENLFSRMRTHYSKENMLDKHPYAINCNKNIIENAYKNLRILMERFGHECQLDYERATNDATLHRFFIGNSSSFYKLIVGDVEIKTSELKDLSFLKELTNMLAQINPFDANTSFMIQRQPNTNIDAFVPDADYVIIEDKLNL